MSSQRLHTAFITGASTGIGLAIAQTLLSAGWRVAMVSRRPDVLKQAAIDVTQRAGVPLDRVLTITGDMGQPQDIERAVAEATHQFDGLDLLVANAGLGELVPIPKTDWNVLRKLFDLNTLGVAYLIHRAWTQLRAGGSIVAISSYAALDPFDGFFAYGATKAAVNLLIVSAAKEGRAIGVRAFSVAPGAVETPLLRSAFDESMLPREMCLKPEEVARVVLACANGERDADNGRTIYIRRDPETGAMHEMVEGLSVPTP